MTVLQASAKIRLNELIKYSKLVGFDKNIMREHNECICAIFEITPHYFIGGF